MSIRLVIENAPHSQSQMERTFEGGELTIGRGNDADWQIDDPDQFVSRKHCVISEDDGGYKVTDASRGGVFIDGASTPLGAGNSAVLEHGMRLRFGDIVLRVDMQEVAPEAAEETAATSGRGVAFDFAFQAESQPQPQSEKRPDTLPDPFGLTPSNLSAETEATTPNVSRPLDQTDPFALDLKRPDAEPEPAQPSGFGGGFFDRPSPTPPELHEAKAAPETLPTATSAPQAVEDHPASNVTHSDLRDAFLRGAGLDPSRMPTQDPLAEMEELGKRFNALVEGMMHLLRSRAQEKQNIRVAQTVIGNADVNPLKFMATTQDAVAALIQDRGKGYLSPDNAIDSAFRDMMDHQMRTWTALQSALRRMIDHFDPDVIAAEMEATGLLEALLAGGRSAKLWQLYEERYREIAQAAEDRFLGEVGADFRDAYEGRGKGERS